MSRAVRAAALVALAALLAIVAADVLRRPAQLERAELALESASSDGSWRSGTILPPAIADTLLATRDDASLRLLFQRFLVRSRPGRVAPDRDLQGRVRRVALEAALVRAGEEGPRRLCAQAHALHGVLLLEEVRSVEVPPETFLRRSLSDFRTAVRLDPSSEEARYDLEVTLRLLQTLRRLKSGDLAAGPGARPTRGRRPGTLRERGGL